MLLFSATALGCSSNDAETRSGGAGGGGAGGAGGGGGGASTELRLDPPANGFQIASQGTLIAAGQDVEYCEVGVLPGTKDDVYHVGRIEVAMTPFSHHLNLYSVVVGSAPDQNAKLGDRVECLQPNLGFGTQPLGEEFRYVVGSQKPYGDRTFPEGVGLRYVGGQKVIFNYHYLNTSSEPARARHLVNFHLVDAARITRTPQIFAMMNQTISVNPRSKASYTMECKATQRIVVYGLSRHTHRWGTEFVTWFEGGARHGQHVFTSQEWNGDNEFGFVPPTELAAGEGFRFRCDFDNPEAHPLAWGDKATDEMCILYGSFWLADANDVPTSQSCLATAGFGSAGPDGVAHGVNIGWPPPID